MGKLSLRRLSMKLLLLIICILLFFGSSLSESRCSKRVFKWCRRNEECLRDDCVNLNSFEPGNKARRRKYCRKVQCVSPTNAITTDKNPCLCPQYYKPVCDLEGKQYSNIDCALCEGADPGKLGPCLG